MDEAEILRRGFYFYRRLADIAERLHTEVERLNAKLIIPIEVDTILRSSRVHMSSYDWRTGDTPPLYGIPIDVSGTAKEIELWVQIK